MAYIPLQNRLADLPLVICGPILRAVSPDSITVWVALKEERNVTLKVFLEKDKGLLDEKFTSPASKTIKIGENVHLSCITVNKDTESLVPGELYYYDLFFEAGGTTKSLLSEKIIDFDINYKYEDSMDPKDIETDISAPPKLPSFSLPPDKLNELRIVHGSCRKPNAEGLDAMPTIDKMIATNWTFPSKRPHFLFLTGDQIYADDVSPILLKMFIDSQETLMGVGRQETFDPDKIKKELKIKKEQKTHQVVVNNGETIWTGQLPPPRKRGPLIKHFAKFSDDNFDNHIISFGEYCMMYLFVWSDVLWIKEKANDTGLPEFEDIYPDEKKTLYRHFFR